MIKSMTGFGRGEAQQEGKKFVVEIRTVNHRYSDIFLKMPRNLSFLEDKVRDLIGRNISRGKIDVFVTYDDSGIDSKVVQIDHALAKAYIQALMQARDIYGLRDDLSASLLTRIPDVMKVEKPEIDEEIMWMLLKEALENSLESLLSMRKNEGRGLKDSVFEKLSIIEGNLDEIKKRSPDVVAEYKAKLNARIKDLLDQANLDEARLATEVAIFADRCSIDEEIVRLGSHIGQFKEALGLQQPVGRKLDFLVQEMNREINTIGSKANDLMITRNVVEVKSEIEKIREQIQNIE